MNSLPDSTTVFVINLKKDIKKKEHMIKLCKMFFLDCNFFDAVYGKFLSKEEIHKHYTIKKSKKYSKKGMSLGEIGCLLSHKTIYQKMIDENIKQALILEDDIEFSNDIVKIFDSIDLFPKNWELMLLGHHSHAGRDIETWASIWWQQNITKEYKIIRPSEIGKGTYGYLINNRGAKKLLSKLDQYYKPIDHYTGNDKEVNIYAISPAPIKIHADMSDNYHSMEDRTDAVKKMVADDKSSKLSPKNLLRSLGLFDSVVFLRDFFKTFLPTKKYK